MEKKTLAGGGSSSATTEGWASDFFGLPTFLTASEAVVDLGRDLFFLLVISDRSMSCLVTLHDIAVVPLYNLNISYQFLPRFLEIQSRISG